VSEWSFVIAAYAVTWIVFLGYTIHLERRHRRAARALENGADTADSFRSGPERGANGIQERGRPR
jgi:CcmD family protein